MTSDTGGRHRARAVVWPRALWRFGRGLTQVLRGVAIVVFRFPRLDAAGRAVEVGRWSAGVLRSVGIGLAVEGRVAGPGTLLAANHVSWLDIVAIHATVPAARFVSKAAVRDWPVFGRLADAGGTLYLARESKRDALRLVGTLRDALAAGATVAVFPEGTTGEGWPLLPFHANLLQAPIAAAARVQPVAIRYSDADGPFSRAVEFVGRTSLLRSVWRVVAAERLVVHLNLEPPLDAAGAERRALARQVAVTIATRLRPDLRDGQEGEGLSARSRSR